MEKDAWLVITRSPLRKRVTPSKIIVETKSNRECCLESPTIPN